MALIDHLMGESAGYLAWLVNEVTLEDKEEGTDHRAVLDWCVLGPRLALLFTGRELREPTFGEFSNFTGVVQTRAPELIPLVDFVARCSPMSTMLAIKQLVEHDEPWAHPSQALARPRPSPASLLRAYKLIAEEDNSAELLAIRDRLVSAERVERSAAARRRKQARGRNDVVVRLGSGGKIARFFLMQFPKAGLSRDGIAGALRAVRFPHRMLETAMHYLGVREEGRVFQLVESEEFESRRRMGLFLLEQVGQRKLKMKELAAVAYRNRQGLRITGNSFVAACRWMLEIVEGEGMLKDLASSGWDGAAAES